MAFSEYVQGGASFRPGAGKKRTKGALKIAIKENPEQVLLYDTSAFSSKFNGPANSLPKDYCFNVVGPDPYNDRSWYASVKWGRNGLTVT
jgi:hypothetical protein